MKYCLMCGEANPTPWFDHCPACVNDAVSEKPTDEDLARKYAAENQEEKEGEE